MSYKPSKLTDQIVISTEAQTLNLIRVYKDWRHNRSDKIELSTAIESYLNNINDKSHENDVDFGFLLISKTIETMDMALDSMFADALIEINDMIIDFKNDVEYSTFKRVTEVIKKKGKINIISLFCSIYARLKRSDSRSASNIQLRFYTAFLDIMSDVKEIYDGGLAREVQKPKNIKKFKYLQEKEEDKENKETVNQENEYL